MDAFEVAGALLNRLLERKEEDSDLQRRLGWAVSKVQLIAVFSICWFCVSHGWCCVFLIVGVGVGGVTAVGVEVVVDIWLVITSAIIGLQCYCDCDCSVHPLKLVPISLKVTFS
jgi:hypothetical protein